MLHHIKRRFCTEIPRALRPNSLVSISRILIINLDRLASPPSRRSIRHELRMTALLETHEIKHRRLDRLPTSQEAMILQERRLLPAKRRGDSMAFFSSQHNSPEGIVHGQIVVEDAGVLRDDVDGSAEGAEGAAVDGVGVRYAVDFGTRCVHGMMDHVGGSVEKAAGAAVNDLAVGADADKVRCLNDGPGDAKGVDPE